MDTVLIIIGYIVDKVQRLNIVALRRYKTNLFKKRINPNINHIGGETTWNDINHISIGDNTYINGAELLTTEDSRIVIGASCLISYDVVIRTDMHKHDYMKPIIEQGNMAKEIVIGDNVWIGHGVYIMPGVTIGNNSIIGAKAVVTKSIPADSIAVGIPAKVVKSRK